VTVVAFDASGPVIGVALVARGRSWHREGRIGAGADAVLLPWCLELLDEAGVALSEVVGVGVAAGPGTFTGLRVGIATAAGLAQGLGVPLWEEGSLCSRAWRARNAGAEGDVLALLDARKGRVYASWLRGDMLSEPVDVPPADAWAEAAARGAPFVATGEGAVVYRALVEAAGGHVAPEAEASAVDTLAWRTAEALAQGQGGPATRVAPRYVRPPDAKVPADLRGLGGVRGAS
jgi:tRNA threonylcarbamoyladenosine biosynthesis protein TsaB